MSQFFWQHALEAQQQEDESHCQRQATQPSVEACTQNFYTNVQNGWNNIGLTSNGNDQSCGVVSDGCYNNAYQFQSCTTSDPYSAAVAQGYVGEPNSSFHQYIGDCEKNKSRHSGIEEGYVREPTATKNDLASSPTLPNGVIPHPYGIHQPILPSRPIQSSAAANDHQSSERRTPTSAIPDKSLNHQTSAQFFSAMPDVINVKEMPTIQYEAANVGAVSEFHGPTTASLEVSHQTGCEKARDEYQSIPEICPEREWMSPPVRQQVTTQGEQIATVSANRDGYHSEHHHPAPADVSKREHSTMNKVPDYGDTHAKEGISSVVAQPSFNTTSGGRDVISANVPSPTPLNTYPTIAVAQITPIVASQRCALPTTASAETSITSLEAVQPQIALSAIPSVNQETPVGSNVARVGPLSSLSESKNVCADVTVAHQTPVSVSQSVVIPSSPAPHSVPSQPSPKTMSSAHQPVLTSTAAVEPHFNNITPVLPDHRSAREKQASVPINPTSKDAEKLDSSTVEEINIYNRPDSTSQLSRNEMSIPNERVDDTKSKAFEKEQSKTIHAKTVAKPSSKHEPEAQEENSSATGSIASGEKTNINKKSVRDRYRSIKQQYPEVMKRLNRFKLDAVNSLDWRQRPKNLLLFNAFQNLENVHGRRKQSDVLPRESESCINFSRLSDAPVADMKMNNSFTVPENLDFDPNSPSDSTAFGDDFVTNRRKSRFARAREYASLRTTRSEIGEVGPYQGPSAALHRYRQHQRDYGYDMIMRNPYHDPSGRFSVGPSYGHRITDYESVDDSHRRPMSSFAVSARSKYGAYGMHDAYQADQEEDEDNMDEETSESGGTDEEMMQIHYQREMMRRANMIRGELTSATPNEYYYFGVIQLSQERVQAIMHRYPPPPEYFQLPPIEKAAFLFYCALYRRHFTPVDLFHKRFNREYYSYTCEGDSSEVALWKICKHTQDEFNARMSAKHLKAYEASQRQLFSDERETPDAESRLSDSRIDHEDDSDRLSTDSALREPLKFRTPHSFARFSAGGRIVLMKPETSTSVLEIKDIKDVVLDPETLRTVEIIESFRGPLVAGCTPPHSVRLFVQRQIDKILQSDVYHGNPLSGDANDCLLIWQLLEMLVQQQGRVTGPDLSRLLMNDQNMLHSDVQEEVSEKIWFEESSHVNEKSHQRKAHERYREFLLGGHIDEAIECAMKDGLYSDAMILARRVYPGDIRKLEKIETVFLAQRSEHDPVLTLLSVANNVPAPILTNPPTDDASSWRSHAAIVLANLSSQTAMSTIYRLGRVLSCRDYCAAADFCFLAVNIFTGYDPFCPVAKSEEDGGTAKQHISLIHASLPDDENDTIMDRFGWSLTDLHATEVFEYAMRLASNGAPTAVGNSLEYQQCRLQYAEMLAELGGFNTDAFHYCVEVARGIWDRLADVSIENLERLCGLADRLRYLASAQEVEVSWIPQMKEYIDQRLSFSENKTVGKDIDASGINSEVLEESKEIAASASALAPATNVPIKNELGRHRSVSSEAADWHADHQEPLEISAREHASPRFAIGQDDDIKQEELSFIDGGVAVVAGTSIVSSRQQSSNGTSARAVSAVGSSKEEQISATVTRSGQVQTSSTEGYPISASSVHVSKAQVDVTKYRSSGHSAVPYSPHSPLTTVSTEKTSSGATYVAEATVTMSSSNVSPLLSSRTFSSVDPNRSSDSSEVLTQQNAGYYMYNESTAASNGQSQFMPPFMPQLNSEGLHNDARSQSEQSNATSSEIVDDKKSKNLSAKPLSASENHSSSGLFSLLKSKIAKVIPTGNEMILPDDKNPSIVWDEKLGKYVGAGVEEENDTGPPPSAASSQALLNGSSHESSGGLKAARSSGGSRYFNAMLNEPNPRLRRSSPAPVTPPMPVPTMFGFIPTMPGQKLFSTVCNVFIF
ncbi:hypothetical protein AB6A40_001060 [Gnathostoma spinigerum]|uniref:Protein transport protein sec16 n=1 Tax=Gnathostoma spinigerum TaxID=75299 RepID=A0ABD6EA95_9BILA